LFLPPFDHPVLPLRVPPIRRLCLSMDLFPRMAPFHHLSAYRSPLPKFSEFFGSTPVSVVGFFHQTSFPHAFMFSIPL
jgi:hypothetical protein